ncbi:unnamed protein product, partial [Didymodactylos carnosus]
MSTSPPSSPSATNSNTIDPTNDSMTTSAPDTTTKCEAVDNFKQAEETLLKIIPVLDRKQTANLFKHYQQECDIQKQRAAEIQQALGAIPQFKGVGAEEWFSDVLQKFGEFDLDPETMLYCIRNKFVGAPLLWYYENSFEFTNFPTFVKSFRLKYMDSSTSSTSQSNSKPPSTNTDDPKPQSSFNTTVSTKPAFQRLKNYQQTNNQTVKQYYAEILKLCKEADIQMSEQMKLQYLLDNLKPSIKIKVIEKSPKTTAQILEYAKTVEDPQTLISSDPNLSHSASNNVTATSTTSRSNTSLKVYIPPPRRSNSNQTQQEQSFPTSTEPQSNSDSIRFAVRLINSVVIPPHENQSVPVFIDISKASAIFYPSFNFEQRSPVVLCNNILEIERYHTSVLIQNPSSFPQYLAKGLVVGVVRLPTSSISSYASTKDISNVSDKSVARINIDNLLNHLNDDSQNDKLKESWLRYEKRFDTSKPTVANTSISHAINTIDHPPSCSKPYPLSHNKKKALYNIICSLIDSGHFRESHSPYSAPTILIDKKDKSYRLVVDYKKLNAITIKDKFPLPNMEETLQEVGGGYCYFSKLDLKSGFWQLPIDEKDRHKTAF